VFESVHEGLFGEGTLWGEHCVDYGLGVQTGENELGEKMGEEGGGEM
jgi:hypothetical protein